MWPQLLLGILALSSVLAEKLFPNYVVTLPAQLNFPSAQKVCLDLSPGYSDVKFTITLETKDKTQKLLEHTGLKKRHLHCISFLVPPPAGGTEEVATIRVSGTGKNVNFEEKKKVLIQRQGNGVFIQTDKPVYNPGQLVHFRIVTLNSNFASVNEKYSLVELQDPNSNRIAQWLEVVPEQGIIDLSFQLAPEASLGTYTVVVAEGKTFGTFSVEEYVLPRFKVELVEPKQLSTVEDSFLVKICCRYIYGKPVQGVVQVSACQKAFDYWSPEGKWEPLPNKCRKLSGQTDRTGCFSASVDMSTFNLTSYMYNHNIDIVASVAEEGTGMEANTTQSVYISSQMGSMTFEDTNNFYYPNFPFSGKIRVKGHDDSLLKNHPVFLVIYSTNGTINHTLVTDDSGLASFKLETVNWNGTGISLEGKFQMEDLVHNPEQVPRYYQNAYLYLQPFYNTTRSFLGIHQLNGILKCSQPQEVLMDYYIDPADATPDQDIVFTYFLMGKGSLEMEGQKYLNFKKQGRKGSISLSLTFTSRVAPDPSLLVYAIFPNGGVIADKIQFSVEMCFDNQVSLGFSPSQQLPGADVELQLQAAPQSLCAVRAVDESVLLLRPERELSNSSVYGMFPFWYGHYPNQVAEFDECPVSGLWDPVQPLIDPVPEERWSKRSTIWRPWYSEGTDLFRFFREMGLKVLSNAKIKKPVDCSQWSGARILGGGGNVVSQPMAFESTSSSSSSPLSEESQVRQYFPDTWLWDLFPVGNSGKETVHVTIPDTITEWKAMTFCTSQSSGFGLSPTVGLTAFKPFFIDLTLPYSIIRGESFRLTATVFNYLKDCIRVQTHLAQSVAYHMESQADTGASICLCADEAKTYHWNVTAVTLGLVNFTISTQILDSNELCGDEKGFVPAKGQSDTLIKPVLVKPEGVLVEKTHSSLLCPKGKVASESISLELPVDVVPDSAKATITATGDIMGTALQNLDNLVQMPGGCGEQNMLRFAPIIYVLQYLEKSGQLTEEIRSLAVGFLEQGYQQELLFKHRNGSYSAFGEQDEHGNTWLTAFVTKCFVQAQKFIFIDDKTIQAALKWMGGNQLPSGCYTNVGKLFHTAMKGGVDDEVSLTAYITAALLEMGKTTDDPMVSRGLQCLRSSVSSTTSLYTQALLAYTFSLTGDMDIRNTLLEKLDHKAVVSGQSIYWSEKPARSSHASPWSEPKAVDVELTAYVLLTWLSKAGLTQKEIAKATGIVSWLTKQHNAYGGFSSTQDTVVALQALAKYATTAYVSSNGASLTVKSTGNFQHTFSIQAANSLVFHQKTLPNAPGVYTLEASGQGCVYVQVVLRYNILPPKNMETFSLSVEMGNTNCEQPVSPRSLTLSIHASYVGSRSSSNMAIVEVKMLSGFNPIEGTNQLLLQQPLVKKVEYGTDTLNIYLEELSKETRNYTFTISQSVLVTNLKPAAIKVYDYYLPDEQATIQYSDPCE